MKINDVKYKVPTKEKNTTTTASYETSDLYLSGFLKAKGIALEKVLKKDRRTIFVFKNDGSIQELISKYINDCDVPVLRFKAALLDLKSIIFNDQKLLR